MAFTLFTAYVAIALVVTVLAFVASMRLGEDRRPALQRLLLSVAAGLFWPVVLLGLVELSSFAVYAKVHENDDEKAGIEVLA